MTKREALQYAANENSTLFNNALAKLREAAENVEVGDEHLSGNDEVFDAGKGNHWKGFGTRFISVKRSHANEWSDKVNIEFYNKEGE